MIDDLQWATDRYNHVTYTASHMTRNKTADRRELIRKRQTEKSCMLIKDNNMTTVRHGIVRDNSDRSRCSRLNTASCLADPSRRINKWQAANRINERFRYKDGMPNVASSWYWSKWSAVCRLKDYCIYSPFWQPIYDARRRKSELSPAYWQTKRMEWRRIRRRKRRRRRRW